YIKLYEFWEPLATALREQTVTPESYKDLWDPAKYKEMMDKVFGFTTPESVVEFHAQASKLLETWGLRTQGIAQPWSEAAEKNIKALIDLYAGDSNASMGMVHNAYAAFEKTFGKAFKIPAVGKDREQVELLLKTMDRYSVFLAKNAEFQHVMYVTGEKAMEKVVEAMADRVKENAEAATIEEFFKLWTSISEKDFLLLFKTQEFSKLQGLVLSAALDARRAFHQLMEVSLSDYPIALRSEMDDVYKTVYKLRRDAREVGRLRSQVSALTADVDKLKDQIRRLQRDDTTAAKRVKKKTTATTRTTTRAKAPMGRKSRKEVKR
ncbi:MAG: poly(R)-hydroxyalkanoic acid synthase subunit PhaE, partial [bacterium]|nr:poly(R)-hydroxyalkanoic acid synthase subunit PhaE [bacterium]